MLVSKVYRTYALKAPTSETCNILRRSATASKALSTVGHGGESETFQLWSTDRLCGPLPPIEVPAGPAEQLTLADDHQGGPVDVLIGADQLYRVVSTDFVILSEGLRALDTIFGYVLHGQDGCTGQPPRHSYHCQRVECMWDLDSLGIFPGTEEVDTETPEPVWDEKEQRYEMGLLWCSDQRPISNRTSSLARTRRMTERMDDEKKKAYEDNIMKLQQDAVIEPSPHDTDAESAFFLPHRGLHRNNKLRIVFDGSAKDGVGVSLNAYLKSGENLLHRLVSVFLRFRVHPIACQADIKAAFHQIAVREEDRAYLQFLWQGKTLQFRRVPFGLTCSPFMLLRSIETHLQRYEITHSTLCKKIAAGLYMDDIAVGFNTREEATEQMAVVNGMFQEAGMETHKVRMTGVPSENAKILGLEWNTELDSLAVDIPQVESPKTKSQLLSVISRPFDPFGMLSPWVIQGKILFQQTWLETCCPTWDSDLPPEIERQAQIWWEQAREFPEVTIPRALGKLCDDTNFHVFCDASRQAYCAVVYAVHGGTSRFILAKSRLAPLQPSLTIPRLELMAALIGVRLMSFIKETLSICGDHVQYWTDSMDVLYWIWSQKPLKMFVRNRVSAILEVSQPEQWKHVKGDQNPADLGTRGISLRNLTSNGEWWNGPPFLLHADLPDTSALFISEPHLSEEAEKEISKATRSVSCPATANVNTVTPVSPPEPEPFQLTNCSELKQAVNRTAWMLRFIGNCRKAREHRVTGVLRPEERQHAVHHWIKLAQRSAYIEELKDLRTHRPVSITSPLRKLRPHLDDNDILRATPRTGEPAVIILPELHHITKLLVEHAHRLCFHQGVRSTLTLLAAEYLVRRKTVRRIVQDCTKCRRYRAQPYQQTEGGLPEFLTQPSRSFENVGIDYFGPLHVDNDSKVWGLLITCATTRAIHLEVVRSQSTEDLQAALRRFFALRGHPSLIVSDNAKSFHKILGLLPAGTKWRYIPEASPWWGGFWERLVGCVKAAMRTTLHQCHLTHDELVIVFYELAMHLNLRPLTEDVTDGVLTPAHFLFGVTHIQGVIAPVLEQASTLSRAWKNRKRTSEQLMKRWTTEYLQSLRGWNTRARGRLARTPRVGETVLVEGEGSRGRWPLGRVLELISGRDGEVRAVKVKVRGRCTRRPVTKLYRLEAAVESE